MLPLLLQLGMVLFIALLVWHFLRGPCNLRIVVNDAQIDVQGSVLAGKRGQIVDFFREDLPDVHRARVEGYWNGRRLRLRFRGQLSRGHRQRIRNFLLVTL